MDTISKEYINYLGCTQFLKKVDWVLRLPLVDEHDWKNYVEISINFDKQPTCFKHFHNHLWCKRIARQFTIDLNSTISFCLLLCSRFIWKVVDEYRLVRFGQDFCLLSILFQESARLLWFLFCHSHFSFDLHISNTRSTFKFIFTHLISIEFFPINFNNPIESMHCTNQNNNKVAMKTFSSVQFDLCECCCQYKV